MTRNKVVLTLVILSVALIPCALPAISQAGVLSLSIEPGGRANGMGRAYSAVADDAYAAWWNPGALAFNRKTQFAGSHTPWLQGIGFDDMYYEFFAWNQFFPEIGNIGMNIVWMDLGSQMQTGEDGQELGEFHSYDLAAAVSYASEVIPEKLGIGGNFKVIYSYLGPGQGQTEGGKEGSGFSWAFDLGLKMKDIFNLSTLIPSYGIPGFEPSIDAALVVQNVGPDITYINEAQSDPLPQTVRAGLALNLLNSPLSKFKLSGEASKIIANEDNMFARFATGWTNPSFNETIYAAGAEYTYFDLLSLRAGWFHDKAGNIMGPSYGAGIQYGFSERVRLSADVGMIDAGDLTDYNYYYSLSFEF